MLFRWLLSTLMVLPISMDVAAQTTAQQLFERVRPSVVEILTQTRGNGGIASSASGFLTYRQDWVVTNYHAVSKVIFEPEDNDLMVEDSARQRVAAKVIAADVRNDLAILKLSKPMSAPLLNVQAQLPAKGETGYSIGKPGQYKHSIVSGTFNGLVEEDITPLLVFSGPINRGMSGGPTLNEKGLVVGVNVASSTTNQLLGLLVPARAVEKLTKSTATQAFEDNAALLKNIASQFSDFGRFQQQQLSKLPHAQRRLGPFLVQGDLSADDECAAVYKKGAERTYTLMQQRCESPSGLFVSHGVYAGQMITGAFWLEGKGLSDFAMSRLVERRLSDLRKVDEDEATPERWKCSEQRLTTQSKVPVQLHACRRPIQKLPGLADYRFRYTPLVKGRNALIVAIGLHGYDDATAQLAIKRSLASLEFNTEVAQ